MSSQWQPVPQYRPPARRASSYPSRLVRFPVGLLPRGRRRGGRSFVYYVYLGTHPVAVLFALLVTLYVSCLLAGWVLLVAMGWLMWAGLVSAWWLCTFPFTAWRR